MATKTRTRRSRTVTRQLRRQESSVASVLRPHGRKPFTKWGRPLRPKRSRLQLRRRLSRDSSMHTSDTVWTLVEKMLEGDVVAAKILNDVIEEGVSSGKTKFVKITRRAFKRFGKTTPESVVADQYAAITPGSQIVLFGVKDQYEPGKRDAVKRGYISRYKIGDTAEYDSYNLVYFGTISAITNKRVTIDKGRGYSKKASLDIEQFSNKNWDPDNLEEGLKRNRNWSD